ncbi:MAG: glycosyltransferase family 2 protein [Thermodesulfobacteriota bacterium]|nr:glycosyltransferase family 2 protein [Thermodesulfobacteriota bacterium]
MIPIEQPWLRKGWMVLAREGIRPFCRKAIAYLHRNRRSHGGVSFRSDYARWVKTHRLTEENIESIRHTISELPYRPKFSVIMPVFNVKRQWLVEAIDSVRMQIYENWDLCIADDGSTKPWIREILERYSRDDKRIKVKFLDRNRGISMASNEALSLATGEFAAMLDHDDELSRDALYENVKLLNRFPEADLIYSDEDKIESRGKRVEPFFKPDYSPDLLLSRNYLCHFCVIRMSAVDAVGRFRPAYDGAQDYDLILRCIDASAPEKILHVPKILYHWRKAPKSTAADTNAKHYAFDSAKKALLSYLERNRIEGEVLEGKFPGAYRVRKKIRDNHRVSIIIPFKDQGEVLQNCVKSILKKTTYKNYRIFLVNNGSKGPETQAILNEMKEDPRISFIEYNNTFNYASMMNYAVSEIDSDYFILLNNDTEVITKDWIEAMLEFGQREDVGAVGALLYYPDDTIQHAGVIIGVGGVAAHSHRRFSRKSRGYYGRIQEVQNLSAVTAACMLTKRPVFEEVNGLDENLSHAFNDVDYCMKIREKGYLIVYTPYAELYHYESLSRGYEDSSEKRRRFGKEVGYFQKKWEEALKKGDPYYNPNLTLDKEDFSLRL